MFKMSAFSVDTSQQTTPPFVDGVVHNRLVQLAPHWDQTLAQLLNVLDYAVVHMVHGPVLDISLQFRLCKNYWNMLRFDRVAVKCTLLRFISERELKFTFAICRRPSVCRLSSVVCRISVCNVGAPYSGDWNFRKYFYALWYLGHPWPLYKNFTEIVPGNPSVGGVKHEG